MTFDGRLDKMLPNIDQNSSPKKAKAEKDGKTAVNFETISDHLTFTSSFPVINNTAVAAVHRLSVRTTPRSQQDKTVIMK